MYLIDTNVLSELRKSPPNHGVLDWLAVHSGDAYLSALNLGELAFGAELLRHPAARAGMLDWVRSIERRFEGRILAFDKHVAIVWARLQAESTRAGRTIPIVDNQIAATAVYHGLTVITRNVRHFEFAGVPVENPWGI